MPLARINVYIISIWLLALVAGIADVAYASSHITTPSICPATLTQGTEGVSYSYTFRGNGGSTWSIIAGIPPPGLTLNGTSGILSGTPSTSGTYSFTVQLLASGGTSDTCACTLTIVGTTCSFVSGISSGAISFSSIDPSLSGTVYGTVTQQISFTCTISPIAYSITVSPSSGWTLQSGSNTMPFTPGITGNGTYTGTPVNLLIASGSGASSILQTNFNNAPAGLYGNGSAITISVNFSGLASPITATLPINSVSGTVISICTVSQSPGTLTFNIDPSISGTTSATISPDMQIKCTRNSPVTISASSSYGGASPKMQCTSSGSCGTSQIPYTFKIMNSSSWPVSTTGAGFGGAGIAMQISGSVSSSDYANAPIGTYGDTETVTISY